jgi:hypothetical protein
MKFEIPVEEKWVKRVEAGFPNEINDLFDKVCDNKNYRSVQIIGFSGDKILVTYETLVGAKTEGENT